MLIRISKIRDKTGHSLMDFVAVNPRFVESVTTWVDQLGSPMGSIIKVASHDGDTVFYSLEPFEDVFEKLDIRC